MKQAGHLMVQYSTWKKKNSRYQGIRTPTTLFKAYWKFHKKIK